jgi:hypothetical protein
MVTSAGKLERSADAFANDSGGYFRAAPEFADKVRDFREAVERSGDREVILNYEKLWRSYQALRREVERSDIPQLRVDFESVTSAFHNVVGYLNGYADNAVYARGGYQHDPYYDP